MENVQENIYSTQKTKEAMDVYIHNIVGPNSELHDWRYRLWFSHRPIFVAGSMHQARWRGLDNLIKHPEHHTSDPEPGGHPLFK